MLVAINIYVGLTDHRMMSYLYQLAVFTAVGYALRRYEMIPTLFGFLLANELEAVTYRSMIL
jgi:TctA family transporter